MKGTDAGKIRVSTERSLDVEGHADLDVLLGKVVVVDEDFADLVFIIWIGAFEWLMAFFKEFGIAATDYRL